VQAASARLIYGRDDARRGLCARDAVLDAGALISRRGYIPEFSDESVALLQSFLLSAVRAKARKIKGFNTEAQRSRDGFGGG